MGETTEIRAVPIDDLKPYEKNAKVHSQKQIDKLVKSIKEFGFISPCLIDADMNIIAGHGRTEAAKQAGLKEVPCVFVEGLTEEQKRAYILADNRLGEIAEWNMDLVNAELLELKNLDFDISVTGFELNDQGELKEDEFEDRTPEEPNTKPGQIFKLGRHRLICGDSTDAETIKKLMDGNMADLLLTDPPYNVDVGKCDRPNSKNNGVGIMNDKMESSQFIEFLTKALSNARDNMRSGASFYVWYAGLHHAEFEKGILNTGFKIHEQLIWAKSHFVLCRNADYQWAHECCIYGWKEGAPHYFTDSRSECTIIEDKAVKLSTLKKGELIELCEKLMGQDKSTTILRADKPASADLHPTVKPQELIGRLLKNSSKQEDNVLDVFGGSGSTLIACEQLKRNCYTCELDPHYCDVIIQRWEDFTGSKAELLNP